MISFRLLLRQHRATTTWRRTCSRRRGRHRLAHHRAAASSDANGLAIGSIWESKKLHPFQPSFPVTGFVKTRSLSQQTVHDSLQWRILQDETDLLLSTPDEATMSSDALVDVLSRWQSHPSASRAAKVSHELLCHWLKNDKSLTTSEPFLLVMQSWKNAGSAYEAADVMDLWVQLLEGDIELAPDRKAYHVLLKSFADQGIVEECLGLLEYMERMKSMGSLALEPPNVETYAHVVTGLTKKKDPSRWGKLQDIMTQMNKAYRLGPQSSYYRLQAYSQAVNFAVSIGKDIEAMKLLNAMIGGKHGKHLRMADMYWNEFPHIGSSPTFWVGSAYQSLLAMRYRRREAPQMNLLLSRLEEFSIDSGLPSPQHYAMTIDAWCKASVDCDEKTLLKTAARCEEILSRMEERHEVRGTLDKHILSAYERVIWINSRARQPAERILPRLMALLNDVPDKGLINEGTVTAAWNHVLRSYYATAQYEKVTTLWKRMDAMGVLPNKVTLEVVLRALSGVTRPDAARQAEHLLRTFDGVVGITAAHYEAVIVAWCSHSPQQSAITSAKALLEELEQRYDDATDQRRKELRPTVNSYNTVILALARTGNNKAIQQVLDKMVERGNHDQDCPLPTTFTFNALLDGLSRERTDAAAREAESILEIMESSSEIAQPDRISYTSVMSVIARSRDSEAPGRCMRIYERMFAASEAREKGDILRPDVLTYGLLHSMWSKSRRRDAGQFAEQLLRDMQENGLSANTVNYNNVILAHARSKQYGSFERAHELLREMEEKYEAGDESVKPNTVTYTNTIQALKRSMVEDKAQVALKLLQEMSRGCAAGNKDLCPNVITMNSVLTACAFTKGDEEVRLQAVQVALAVFSEMEKLDIAPCGSSFRILIETFGRQVSDLGERTKMAEIALQRCHREGLVDPTVVGVLQRYVPRLFEKIASSLETPPDEVDGRNGGSTEIAIRERKQ